MLTPDRKKHVWQHLLGNYVNVMPSQVKQRSKNLAQTLSAPQQNNNPKGMYKFIDYQLEHFSNNSFAAEINLFKNECADTIDDFNKEFETLLQEIHQDNCNEISIRSKIRTLADKRREKEFT